MLYDKMIEIQETWHKSDNIIDTEVKYHGKHIAKGITQYEFVVILCGIKI